LKVIPLLQQVIVLSRKFPSWVDNAYPRSTLANDGPL
jgi:hypothetical protein